ncbi:peptidase M48 [Erythrobacter litoralis]|uniref:M48 family metallopeptidase n=1 Tax=Erythrobacter litoralis TaxID=39960 RepID=UPI002434CE60|nr:M48 family metallopeptidase [Erythrobacter litoralis]MDG6077985.1 peptidase M48 [Erythrobacter litoralis]
MVRRFLTTAAVVGLVLQPVGHAAARASWAEMPESYQPEDDLERGLWLQMDEYERGLKSSRTVIHDEALNAYVRSVLCKTVGEAECAPIRLYVTHTPHFNASMAPNGIMQIWSGLLLRTQNEAQLAAVLGHEFAHFEDRHSVKLFRDAKSKSNAASWLAFTGIGLIASIGLLGSIFKFSRDQERLADKGGLQMMARAGYDTREAAVLWEQILDEGDATRVGRGKKVKKRSTKSGLFASHPASAERVAYLREQSLEQPGTPHQNGADAFKVAMRAWWPVFLDDQLKMNDDGASEFLLDSMAKANGWTPWLNYGRAELQRRKGTPADLELAVRYYSEAIADGGDLPELWRGRGLALRKLDRDGEAAGDLRRYLMQAPDAADHAMITMILGGIE